MVNFGKQLLAQREREWKDKYVHYQDLKQILKKFGSKSAPKDQLLGVDPSQVEEEFRSLLDDDINVFARLFHSTHESLANLLDSLTDQIEDVHGMDPSQQENFLAPLRTSLFRVSRSLVQLQSYVVLNYTAFAKICKKHDKMCHPLPPIKAEVLGCERVRNVLAAAGVRVDLGGRIMGTHTHTHASGEAMEDILDSHTPCLDTLLERTQHLFASLFEEGNVADARITLFSHLTKHQNTGFHRYRIGIQMGITIMLLLLLLGLIAVDNAQWAEDPVAVGKFKDTLPIFACFTLLTIVVWLWAVDVHVWSNARINFVFLLELDPRTRLVPTQILDEASKLSIILLVLYCCYVGVISGRLVLWGIPDVAFPLSLSIFFFLKMVWPFSFPFGNLSTRKWVWKSLFRFVTAPFSPVRFYDVFVGDYVCSLVTTLGNLQYTLCFFTSGAYNETPASPAFGNLGCRTWWGVVPVFVSVLPLWWRFCQCLRRYYDTRQRYPYLFPGAFCVALAQVVSLFGAFHPAPHGEWNTARVVWLVFIITTTVMAFFLDTRLDWSLLHRDSKNPYLRDELMYSRRWYYFAAIPFDFCLRFVFMLTIIPYHANPFWSFDRQTFVGVWLPILFGILELFRRCVSGFFRMECEHLSNKEGFREITAVPAVVDPLTHEGVKTTCTFRGATRLWLELGSAFMVVVAVSVSCRYILQ